MIRDILNFNFHACLGATLWDLSEQFLHTLWFSQASFNLTKITLVLGIS